MDPNVTILSLPANFPSPQRASLSKEKSERSVVTAATELTSWDSSCRSGYSIGTNDDFDGFLEALEARYGHDDADAAEEDEEDVLLKLMSYEQGTREIIQPGATRHDTTPTEIQTTPVHEAKFDSLAIKVARIEEKHKMRRMKQKGRIHNAKNEYLECLAALALSSSEEEELTGEFMKEHDLVWKEVEFDRIRVRDVEFD